MDANHNNTTRGIVLMVLSMVCFAIADTVIKMVAGIISPAQVLMLLAGGGLVVFALIAKIRGGQLLDTRAFAPVLLLRYASEIIGLVGMVMALAHVPLSTVGAILQATPMLVALGAVMFLGENVSWRRWTSILLGFVGVLLIIQPGAEGFDMMVMWAVLSVVAMSVRDLTTRLAPANMSSASLATFAMVATLPVAVGWVAFDGDGFIPRQAHWLMVISMIGFGSLGYMLLIISLRQADASTVSPFRYSRLIFLLVIGVVVFDERPSLLTLSGATLIIASGIYMMWRERRAKK